MTTMVGTDGNTYVFEDDVLTITGTGSTSALTEGVVHGENSATMDVSSATKVIYGEGITTIATMQFYATASYISEIEFPSTLTTIGDYAYYPPSSLSSVRIPASVTSIGTQAFIFGAISEVIFEGQPTNIESNALRNSDGNPMTVYSSGWANATTLPTSVTGSGTVIFVTGIPILYKKLTYDSKKVQVESAIRDGNGVKIDTNYAKKADVSVQFTDVSIQFTLQSTPDYEDYPYRGSFTSSMITANTYASVTYSDEQATSLNFSPFCDTAAGVLYIYSRTDVGTQTIPTINLGGGPAEIAIDSSPTSGSGNAVSSGGVYTALAGKQNVITISDQAPSGGSNGDIWIQY